MSFLDSNGVKTLMNLIKPSSIEITLSSSKWSSLSQTVTVNGVLADEAAQLILPVSKSSNSEAYENAGIKITSQSANSLTFSAESAPADNISLFVIIIDLKTT